MTSRSRPTSASSGATPSSSSVPNPGAPMATEARSWRGTCKARCALTGRQCALPAHVAGTHASGPYRFVQVAAPGQARFPKAEELAHAAFSRPEAVIDEMTSSSDGTNSEAKRAARERWRLKKLAERAPANPEHHKEG